ncbi:phosphatidylglycerophosphatase A family protein [Fructilactobacillus fructivorans]|uniref:Low temperature requirement C protein n=1 Tax=Fructilactobacillus fructivorans TaxID=1614 RepID=A0A0C1PMT7_9LACO|nr:phosphatidylglycerophosphatase A [Fructilactobacillus fructivorans]KID42072.1 Low temperature requirement C protein [Fructilactobacillus fructivorans]KRK58470.1 phosphatidylglycerophosphatase A [Fructilactobacillus fructivorans]KRN13311.1 phosphatidylglycerophosphatase A [Fructilactobacillus fructivorans]KRN42314.1 phosphatidylglycerophosphatase A [Fructilactobacillus fructivorans]MCT0151964.1 phosphatidylglycerophosphatase A [Fructilactobacillus fructivorans]
MVDRRDYKYPDTQAYDFVVKRLNEHGVTIKDIAKIAVDLQRKYSNVPDLDYVCGIVNDILHKREVLNNAMVGLELDRLAQAGELEEPLESIVSHDLGVFGVDETLALGIASIYGTIGVTNYGEIDTNKNGIVKELDTNGQLVNTFIDDIVGALAGAAAAKIAHDNA